MILLDTNVVSELMRVEPLPSVMAWFSQQPTESLFLSTISEAELRRGVQAMPEGRRRDRISIAVETLTEDYFAGRILNFDRSSAKGFAEIWVIRRALGRPIEILDAQIAAIAKASSIPLATRNVRDFEHVGIEIINPWAAGPVADH